MESDKCVEWWGRVWLVRERVDERVCEVSGGVVRSVRWIVLLTQVVRLCATIVDIL